MNDSDLRRIKELLEQAALKITEAVNLINQRLGEAPIGPPEWLIQRVFVWNEIYERGGLVRKDEFYRIGREYGYNTRGLGGFFTGKKPSLRYVGVNKDTIVLEDWAKAEVEKYREWIIQNKERYRRR